MDLPYIIAITAVLVLAIFIAAVRLASAYAEMMEDDDVSED